MTIHLLHHIFLNSCKHLLLQIVLELKLIQFNLNRISCTFKLSQILLTLSLITVLLFPKRIPTTTSHTKTGIPGCWHVRFLLQHTWIMFHLLVPQFSLLHDRIFYKLRVCLQTFLQAIVATPTNIISFGCNFKIDIRCYVFRNVAIFVPGRCFIRPLGILSWL